ncbi:MAG: S8 family serine peptidase [archaeon]
MLKKGGCIFLAVCMLFMHILLLYPEFAFAADVYEPDDIYSQATTISTNGSLQEHTISPANDNDFINFSISQGASYIIETSALTGGADTFIYLYDDDGTTLLDSNDDILTGIITSSRIEYLAAKSTFAYVKIKDFNPLLDNGGYTVAVTEVPSAIAAECNNGSSWVNCSLIPFGSNITQIRANCTHKQGGTVKRASFLLQNIQDASNLVDAANASYFESGFFVYNHTTIINDSGTFNLTYSCIGVDNANTNNSIVWEIPWGNLSSYLLYPSGNIDASSVMLFNITAVVSCNGGECQDIEAYLDPKKAEKFGLQNIEKRRVIIKLKEKLSGNNIPIKKTKIAKDQRLDLLSKKGIHANRIIGQANEIAVQVNESMLELLRNDPDIESIREDRIFKVTLDESIPLISVSDIHSSGFNGTGETVCIIDTGVDYNHVDLGGCFGPGCKVIGGYDFYNNDNNPIDDQGHGTHVAGIIASNNNIYRGVSPGAKIVAIKACDNAPQASCYESDIASGIDYCIQNKDAYNISIISMSLGGGVYTSYCDDDPFVPYIIAANANNISVFIASGNAFSVIGISSPACVRQAISVGSTTKSNAMSSFTNRNKYLDILAPGEEIDSLALGGGITTKSGTSMATPLAAGSAATILEYYRRSQGKRLTPDELRIILRSNALDIYDSSSRLYYPRVKLAEGFLEKGIIPTFSGSWPFYTINQNPYNSTSANCLSSIKPNESCLMTWQVNATGTESDTYEFFVFLEDNMNLYNRTNKVNVSINTAPDFNITVEGETAPVYSNQTQLNVSVYDIDIISSIYCILDSVRYNLNSSVQSSAINSSFMLNVTPGRHELIVYFNDSLNRVTNESLVFYNYYEYNLSKALGDSIANISGIISFNITYANGSLLANPDFENTTGVYNLFFEIETSNITLFNMSGSNITWSAALNISESLEDLEKLEGFGSIDALGLIFADFSSFIIIENYYAGVDLPFSNSEYLRVLYYSNESSQPQEIVQCSANTFSYDELPCFTNTTTIKVYIPHFSYIVLSNSSPPIINITYPLNSSVLNTSYFKVNVSTDETSACSVVFENGQYFFAEENETLFDEMELPIPALENGNYNVTVFCNDSYSNQANSTLLFTVNDTLPPVINITYPYGTYTTTSASTYSVPIFVGTDEFSNLTYSLNGNTPVSLLFITNETLSKTTSLSLPSGSYSINFSATDVNNNTNSSLRTFSVSASLSESEPASRSGGSRGGGAGISTNKTIAGANLTQNASVLEKSNVSLVEENKSVEIQNLGYINTSPVQENIIQQENSTENTSETYAESKPLRIIILTGLVILFGLLLIIFVVANNNQSAPLAKEEKELALKVKKYLHYHSKAEIKKKLAAKGWDEKKVDKIIEIVANEKK